MYVKAASRFLGNVMVNVFMADEFAKLF